MADLISLDEAQAWAEPTKLTLPGLQGPLLAHVQSMVLGRVSTAYPAETPLWLTPNATPGLIRTVISMFYISWLIDLTASLQTDELNAYALRLAALAEANLVGIIDGTIDLIEVPGTVGSTLDIGFYPTDESSSLEPTFDDMSLGDAKFSMGKLF